MAEVLQSSGQSGALWADRDGVGVRVARIGGGKIRVELPPGASLRDLEPTASGWVAAGRLPDSQGTDLLLVAGNPEGTDLLPVPRRGSNRFRGQPVLLLERRQLVGLAWAAGNAPREWEIWAASWDDGEWGSPQLVSPIGPGSQVAPAGTVLEDGSWMLVWSAFDGHDDEIVWSRRIGERWTVPQPVHEENDVPDAKPEIVAVEGGAMVVWNWFDGNDYRMRAARWVGNGWQESPAFGGKGSGGPGLIQTDDGILLLYQSVDPASWTVVEFDRAGNERREARILEDTNQRPLLVPDQAEDGILRWPAGDRVLNWRDLP